MLLLVQLTGRILAMLPECMLRCTCHFFGSIIYLASPGRRKMALRNLHHCFPGKNEEWRRKTIREHCRRLGEMAFLILALPYLSERRARNLFEPIDDKTLEIMDRAYSDLPTLLLTPHLTLSEATTTLPLHYKQAKGRISVIFRPIKNPKLNEWVTHARSRFGAELLSRKDGFSIAMKRLESKHAVALLFDQNAGGKGSFIYFMNRVVSATELPGLMALRKKTDAYIIYAERVGFWRARFKMSPLNVGSDPIDLTLSAHEWLAEYLASSDDHCADWLWLHDRWGTPKNPKRRFHLREKRNRLEQDASSRPEKPATTVWFMLPENATDFRDLANILATIRKSRADYVLCLIGEESAQETIQAHFSSNADSIVTLDKDPKKRRQTLRSISEEYPDVWINLRQTQASLKESRLSGADQRFGIATVPKARKYLTDLAPPPNDGSWMPFFEHFGLGTRKKHRD